MKTKACSKCKEEKPLDAFWRDRKRKDGRLPACKDCESARLKKAYKANPELFQARTRRWESKNREHVLQQARDYQQRRKVALRREIFDVYGDYCECCEEDHQEFLVLDHLKKVPIDHFNSRTGLRIGGTQLYAKIKKEGFPDHYRVLCWNCNASIGLHGYCPHEREKT